MKLITLCQVSRPLLIRNQSFFPISVRCSSGKTERSLQASSAQNQVTTDVRPLSERVKETAKTTSYLGVILLGGGVTLAMFYTIFSELFSKNSPNNIYSRTFDLCADDPQVQDALGTPIKGFGEETRRGRRGHVSHSFVMKNGVKHLRMRFYIKGIRTKATVNLEMKESSSGNLEYNFVQVVTDDYPRKVFTIVDNTKEMSAVQQNSLDFAFE